MKRSGIRHHEATDAQGRRRFHGAFTGGFSAGHYNSVGSVEGWTPRTFSSSRAHRSSRIIQHPEDFMDDEDDPLLGKRLETTACYDTLQTGVKHQLQHPSPLNNESIIPGFTLPIDWIVPLNDSIGATLLQQMGWKQGHGIGPRVRKQKFSKHTCHNLHRQNNEASWDDRMPLSVDNVMYGPPRNGLNVVMSFPTPKVDRYGAGFDPYRDAPEFLVYKEHQAKLENDKKGSFRQIVSFSDALRPPNGSTRVSNGYGLSALEDNDEIDVYGTVSMAEFDHILAPRGATKEIRRIKTDVAERKELNRSDHVCSDGRRALPSFEVATLLEKPQEHKQCLLHVPGTFKPFHCFTEEENSMEDAVTAFYCQHNLLCANESTTNNIVTAKQRSALFQDVDVNARVSSSREKSIGSVFELLDETQKAQLFDAAKQAKERVLESKAMETMPDRLELCTNKDDKAFRATISASIAQRFTSSRVVKMDDFNEGMKTNESMYSTSQRSTSRWFPKALLCKRFQLKGMCSSDSQAIDNEKKLDLFDKELVPHFVKYAADRAACRDSMEKKVHVEARGIENESRSSLERVEKASNALLQSIFEPSDEYLSEEESGENSSEEETLELIKVAAPDQLKEKKRDAVRSEVLNEDNKLFGGVASRDERMEEVQRKVKSMEESSQERHRRVKKERKNHKKHKKRRDGKESRKKKRV
ncbi:hypothetical protein CCR75_000318 [Bremia lactucae]|uniref:G-patch domain-containing protein n=1 Tax=Bremia lactucae TaxID=4779 RepID=A0A976FL54_BRELC|nr:hypothetical protein CCR75_000318 [Bremia lactucae]